MSIKEIVRTSGDVRRILAQSMVDLRYGDLKVSDAMGLAALAKEINHSMQTEVNAAKVKVNILNQGRDIGQLTHLGKMIIDSGDDMPLLDGTGK